MVRRAMGVMVLFCLAGLAAVLEAQAPNARTITAAGAKDHIGETATVCGKGLKREQNPARLAATDGELIAGREQLIRRSG
jgi:hypothetical protein